MDEPDSEVRQSRTPSTAHPLGEPDQTITTMTIGGSGLSPEPTGRDRKGDLSPLEA